MEAIDETEHLEEKVRKLYFVGNCCEDTKRDAWAHMLKITCAVRGYIIVKNSNTEREVSGLDNGSRNSYC